MHTPDILGKTFDCDCGRTHSVRVREIRYEPGVSSSIPELASKYFNGQRVTLLADKRTFEAAGRAATVSLEKSGFNVHTVMVPADGDSDPVCDDITRDAVSPLIPDSDFMLAVGSGVVNDLTKWISSDSGVPYAVLATAASMNGYTSNNIAPAISGVKRVVDGTVPLFVASDPTILAEAPFELTAAGLGDVLAKPVSMTDWKLNQVLFGEYYCDLCASMIRELEPGYTSAPELIREKDPAGIESLFLALLYSGLSMTVAGTSSPASGGEHMVSHVLDMKAMAGGQDHDYHGRQVGLGSVFACALYDRVLAVESPEFALHTEPTDKSYWGSLTEIVESEHSLKRAKAERAVNLLRNGADWDNIRSTLAPMTRRAADIRKCLADAGAACRLEHIGCSRDRFLQAVLHSHQIRERYTILDLARATGILPDAAEEIIDEHIV